MAKIIPSEALLNLTVQANLERDKNLPAVSYTVRLEDYPPIDCETCGEIIVDISVHYGVLWRSIGYARTGPNYSHSIVPGGLLVTS